MVNGSSAIDYQYTYDSPSRVTTGESTKISLSCDRTWGNNFSFDAKIEDPSLFADVLLCLSQSVRSNFAHPGPTLLDPVITWGPSGLRFEGFSGCCGVYVQAVFDADQFDKPALGCGTTNVDINDEFRNGLTRLRQTEDVRISVNHDELAVSSERQNLVEKKVRLPLRWIRGLCEVQSTLSQVEHRQTVTGRETLKFIRSLPRNSGRKNEMWATPTGKGIRVSTRESDKAVPFVGTDRLRLLEPLLRSRDCTVMIGRVPDQLISSWFCDFGNCQLLLLLSPAIYRGFSGEGQLLEDLANENWKNAIDQVRANLDWQEPIDVDQLERQLNLKAIDISNVLTALASRGVVGFDLKTQAYFYRTLPFDSNLVESLQPRLIAARKLIAQNQITLHRQISKIESQWVVKGSEVEHLVTLSEEHASCTCAWFSKYQTSRGPCKHILAVNIQAGKNI